MHPLLPNAAFVRKDEDPVLVDISVLERSPEAASVIESMKRYFVYKVVNKHDTRQYLFDKSFM